MREVKLEDSLAYKRPDLAKEWNYEKNGNLKPEKVSCGSHQKVWWKCSKKPKHQWKTNVKDRALKEKLNCPYCLGQRVCEDNCLATVNPDLAKEWHPTKNKKKPNEFTSNSGIKVWWKCLKNPKHEWESVIAKRNSGKRCPYCAGRKVCTDNSLESLRPDLAEEWHPTKNENLKPNQVTCGSNKDVWWKCSKGHEWRTKVNNRCKNNGTNCPKCSEYIKTSFPEYAIYFYIKKFFSDSIHRYIYPNSKVEIDIFIPSINIGIEYDGAYYHKNPIKDIKKSEFLKRKIKLIRIREFESPVLDTDDFIIYREDNKELSLEKSIRDLLLYLKPFINTEIITSVDFLSISRDRLSINQLRSFMELEESLEKKSPELIKEWNQIKNGKLSPKNVTNQSNQKVWWKCSKGHKWEATVSSRTFKKDGCPYCSGHRVCEDNCLATLRPDLAEQWNHQKNDSLTPYDITCGSGIKVWWKCWKGHEWESSIAKRTKGNGCPYCSGHRVCEDNCLAILRPDLAEEWLHQKNDSLTPYDVTCGSNQQVWWRCSEGHEWKTAIYNRTSGKNCSICSHKKARELRYVINIENPLEKANPELAKQWNHYKNGTLTPKTVSHKSEQKVWWICNKGHEWESRIANRARGDRCPYCTGKKVCIDNCLATLRPDLAEQWNQFKNKSLTPYDVTCGTRRKAWWKCSKGHEWEAIVANRVNGRNCPYCAGKKACIDNCLATLNPDLSKEWNYKRNELTPNDLTCSSNKKVWWICQKGHEWEAIISSRNRGVGCPECYKNKVKK